MCYNIIGYTKVEFSKEDRENVVINVEITPPNCSEYNRALCLNPAFSLLFEYLESCEEAEEY